MWWLQQNVQTNLFACVEWWGVDNLEHFKTLKQAPTDVKNFCVAERFQNEVAS